MRVYGVGSPESLVPSLVIPPALCPPIIVGIFHGEERPNVNKFLEPLLDELHKLHPRQKQQDPTTGKLMRRCSVRLRCFICDAKERAWLKGEFKFTHIFDLRKSKPRPGHFSFQTLRFV